ncbi:MAG: serine/threonine-protein kinase [Myxococcota bacterium]
MSLEATEAGSLLLGKYELLDIAGAGGMATVWRALCHGEAGFQMHVAVKRMLPSLSTSEDFAAMFVEEARVVADLQHPNVVRVHDFQRDQRGRFFIVMEWIEGIDFGRWILAHTKKGVPTPWPLVATVGLGVLRALAAAHGRRDAAGRPAPVFHRDVTPSNVLLGPYGEVKLADFGLARAMDRVTLTMPGVVKGKLAYVAPEMVAGERASVGSDLYGLGIVLWEALAGRRLFEGKNDIELFVRVGRGEVPPITGERQDLPPALVALLERLLAKAQEDRFLVAEEAEDALRGVLRDAGERLDPTRLGRTVAEARQSVFSRA